MVGAIDHSEFNRVRQLLTDRFGGLTASTRAPADGFWKDPNDGDVARDEIAVIEVMTKTSIPDVIRWHVIGRA